MSTPTTPPESPGGDHPAAHPPRPRHHHAPPPPEGLLHAFQSLGYIVIVAVFIITFIAQPFRIPSASMEPTLLIGDFLLVTKQNFPAPAPLLPAATLHRGDVIVFHYPIDPSMHLVKRIIGLPGDHLRLRAGRVFIDDHPLPEPYAFYQPGPADNFRDNFPRLQNPDPDVSSNWWIQMKQLVNHGELTVPPGEYFVLGDNRNDSEDSRYWGFVSSSAIVGRPLLIYFSLDEPDRPNLSDEPAAPRLSPPPPVRSTPPSPLSTLFHLTRFARWDRTLRVVR
jgi:signal peptidase I